MPNCHIGVIYGDRGKLIIRLYNNVAISIQQEQIERVIVSIYNAVPCKTTSYCTHANKSSKPLQLRNL